VKLIAEWASPGKEGQFDDGKALKELYRFLYGKEIRPVE
jgi:hypothetical protein